MYSSDWSVLRHLENKEVRSSLLEASVYIAVFRLQRVVAWLESDSISSFFTSISFWRKESGLQRLSSGMFCVREKMEAFIARFIKWPLRVRFRRKSYLRFIPVAEINHWIQQNSWPKPDLLMLHWADYLALCFSTWFCFNNQILNWTSSSVFPFTLTC